MPTVDQFSDPAFATLYKQIKRMPALEGFVKEAEIDPGQLEVLPETAYAWPVMRKFPIHSAQHAALSYAYSKTASWLPDEVHANIKKALEVYQIPETTFTESAEKVAEEVPYALPEFQYLPLRTAGQVKLAQRQLLEDLPKLDMERRALAAANVVKKADEFQVELAPELNKLAGLVVSNSKMVCDWLEARASVSEGAIKRAYETLADGMRKGPEEVADRSGLLKLASAIADLDYQADLDKHYDRRLPDALRTVFNTEKLAAGTIDLGGTHVSLKKLASLPPSFWEDLGGKELSDEIAPGGSVDPTKMATVIETLPLDLKLQLKAYCR